MEFLILFPFRQDTNVFKDNLALILLASTQNIKDFFHLLPFAKKIQICFMYMAPFKVYAFT